MNGEDLAPATRADRARARFVLATLKAAPFLPSLRWTLAAVAATEATFAALGGAWRSAGGAASGGVLAVVSTRLLESGARQVARELAHGGEEALLAQRPERDGPRLPRESITPTYDSRETGPRYWLSTFVAGRTLDWRKPLDDPFVSTRITIGWPDLLRALLHRRLVVKVQVGAERDAIDDVLELDSNQLVPGRTRRDEFHRQIFDTFDPEAQ